MVACSGPAQQDATNEGIDVPPAGEVADLSSAAPSDVTPAVDADAKTDLSLLDTQPADVPVSDSGDGGSGDDGVSHDGSADADPNPDVVAEEVESDEVEPEVPCQTADECPTDQGCVEGSCGACANDGECRDGEECREGECRNLNCYTDVECVFPGLRLVCVAHHCEPCQSTYDCTESAAYGGGFQCLGGECSDANCAVDVDCPADLPVCGGNGLCRLCQNGSGECGEGYVCAEGTCEIGDCWIDGEIWETGDTKPGNVCSACLPARRLAWSPNVGVACNDQQTCTYDDRCDAEVAGACGGTSYVCTPAPEIAACAEGVCHGTGPMDCTVQKNPTWTGCFLGGACYVHDAVSPASDCLVCNAATGGWGDRAAGAACGDGSDQCHAGACVDCTDATGCKDQPDDGLVCSEPACDGASHTCYHDLSAHFGEDCGAGASECSAQDSCDATGICQANHLSAAATCGDDGTECTNQDLCDGAGSCVDKGLQPDGTICGSGDQCHVGACVDCVDDEGCADLPDDGNPCSEPACNSETRLCYQKLDARQGLACGSAADTVCDNPDTCDASGTCQPNAESSTVGCDDANPCTHTDRCDGVGGCAGVAYSCNGHGTCLGDNTCTCALGYLSPRCDYWSRGFGGAQIDSGQAVAADAQGNLFVAGWFQGSADLGGGVLEGAGGADIFVAKYAPDGTHLWSKRFGGPEADGAYAVAVDPSGNVYFAGSFSGTAKFDAATLTSFGGEDVFVAKYSPSGAYIWLRQFYGIDDESVTSLALDKSGNLLIAGYFSGTFDLGVGVTETAGGRDIFVTKYNSAGNVVWGKTFGGPTFDEARAVAVDPSGNVVLSGVFTGSVNFGGGSLSSAGNYDVFMAKYSANGVHQWSKRFGGTGSDEANAIATDAAGNVYLAGAVSSTSIDFGGGAILTAGDAFMAKFAPNATHAWSFAWGGTSSDLGNGIAVSSAGKIALTGTFRGNVDFGSGSLASHGLFDGFVATYESDGTPLWSMALGGTSTDYGNAVAFDPAGNLLVTGGYKETADFGGGIVTSQGAQDLFLLRLP